jgi:hypothetical protein
MRKELNEMAKMRPIYLARSPVSMFKATQFIALDQLFDFSGERPAILRPSVSIG